MSFNENYDKVFLTVGGILGMACIGFGVTGYLGLDEKYTINSTIKSKNVEVPGIAEAEKIGKSIAADHEIQRPRIGAQFFDMFTGPKLWLPKNKVTPIDIHEEGAIHPPIPNLWFIENGLQDLLKYSDALTQDPDKDGFTILEEFNDGTKPNDASSHPLLVKKLILDVIKNRTYYVAFASSYAPEYTFRATDSRGDVYWRQDAKIGDRIGSERTDKDRFILKEVVQREFKNSSTGVTEMDEVAILEDTKPTKAGKIYEIRKGNKYLQTILDSTAVFTIVAGNKSGTRFNVEEGMSFKIPGDEQTEYKLKSIDRQSNSIEVSATVDGKEKSWKIKK